MLNGIGRAELLKAVCGRLPGQYIWQFIVDEVPHTLVFRRALQKKLEGFLVSVIIINQTLEGRCHDSQSAKKEKKRIISSEH